MKGVIILGALSLFLMLNAMDYSVTLVAIGRTGLEAFPEHERNPIIDWILERGLVWFPLYKLFFANFVTIGFTYYQYQRKKEFLVLTALGIVNLFYLYVVVQNVHALGWF